MRSSARGISLALVVVLGLAGSLAQAAAARASGETKAVHTAAAEIPRAAQIGDLGPGSWCWFGDPRAVSVQGQTFVGWIDWQGAIHIAAFDPSFGVVKDQTVGYEYHDDHSSPSILVEPDKRLTVFWSGPQRTSHALPDDAAAGGHQRLGPARRT